MYQEMATIPISKGPGLTLRLHKPPFPINKKGFMGMNNIRGLSIHKSPFGFMGESYIGARIGSF